MKSWNLIVAGSFVLAVAGMSIVAVGDTEPAAAEAAEAAAVEVSEDAVKDAIDEAAQLLGEVDETIQGVAKELETADEQIPAAAAGAAPGADEKAEGQADADASMPDANAAWMANALPNEHHARLDAYVGEWDVTVRFWTAPGMPPQVNQGTSEIKWILDGRFLQENFQSVMQMGENQPETFRGFGLTGYDNIKQRYVGIWADTMSTAVIESIGQFNESTGGLVLNSEFDDPMTGEPTTMRTELRQIGEDELLMEAYKPIGDQDFKCLEITYTRRP